jgi:hypothetical protein
MCFRHYISVRLTSFLVVNFVFVIMQTCVFMKQTLEFVPAFFYTGLDYLN